MLPAILYIFTYATRRDWALYALGTCFAVITGLCLPGMALVYGVWLQAQAVVDSDPHHGMHVAKQTALACLALAIVQGVCCFAFFIFFYNASEHLARRLRHAYVRSIIYHDAKFFEDVGAGEVSTRIVKDIGTVQAAAGEKLGYIIWNLSSLVSAVIIAFVQAPRLTGFLIAIIFLSFILFALVTKPGDKVNARIVEKDGRANTFLEQVLGSIRIVQAFAAEKVLVAKYDKHLEGLEKDGTRKALVTAAQVAVAYFALYLVYPVAIWFGAQEVTERGLQVSSFFAAFFNFFNALSAITNILPHILTVIEAAAAQEHFRAVIDHKPTVDVRSAQGIALPAGSQWNSSIELGDVTFAYGSRPDVKALDGVSLRMEHGKVTAIVGPSGSGKSTIAGLLTRWWDLADPDDKHLNSLTIGENDIKSYNLRWLRSQISTVSQDPQLFTGTICENVAHGLTGTPYQYDPYDEDGSRLAITRKLVQAALVKAQAWSFVSALPYGMDSKISGSQVGILSGGQRQRIAAARALVRNPRILILDEGTSALDAEVERRLMDAVYAEQKQYGMTTILIAHRLSTIQLADNIIVMDKGRVVEQGTYDDLVERQGFFASLVAHQLSTAEEPVERRESKESRAASFSSDGTSRTAPVILSSPSANSSTTAVSESTLENGKASNLLTTGTALHPPFTIWFPQYLQYLKQQWAWFGIGSLLVIGIGVTMPLSAWLFGLTATTFSIQDDGSLLRHEAYRWSWIFLILAAALLFVVLVGGYLLEGGAERVARRLHVSSLRAIVKQEVAFFDHELNSSGSLTSTLSTHGLNASRVLGLIWLQILACGLGLLGSAILSFKLSWKVTVVSFIPLPMAFLAGYLNVVTMSQYEAGLQEPLDRASAYVGENVTNIRTVATLGREAAVLKHFERESLQEGPPKRQLYWAAAGFGSGVAFCLIVTAIVMAWGTNLYARGEISLATLTASLEAVIMAGYSVRSSFSFIPDISRAIHAFRSITAWELRTPRIAHLPTPPGLHRPHKVVGDIRFKGCTMSYQGQIHPALNNLNLHIKAGQNVAFCGPSGGGKSTILALLNRFYDPSEGSLDVDGFDVRSLPVDEYRSNLGLVSQDAVLYDGSFRENITLGMPRDVSDQELEEVCRQARILDFIRSLPGGFNCNVGMKGAQMSGGQRQRVCIARALLRKPRILLLDEATSALDVESERFIQDALEEASVGRTTISVAHRLSTIQKADVIYVVDEGRIVEHGTHTELLRLRGRYFDLIKGQL